MAVSSLPLSWASTLHNQLTVPNSTAVPRSTAFSQPNIIAYSRDTTFNEESCLKKRSILLGLGALATSLIPANFVFADEVPENYQSFIDLSDGYSYYYPSDWRDFDFRGHDSAFKDRYLQLQNVISNLVRHVYAAPSQRATIFDMKERTVDGKNYYTFEYELTSPNFSRTAFATIAIGNGRYYTLIVGANERRWRRVREKLKVVADSFRVLDI
ncbi:PREDICTED: photosynthetic NDH subunit of lumenal location 1, chloroplastic isoform X2 [Nelumbo nucifera]|uniref:Photosynthetic NDH subunit of lumenal location 1, chloroplastic isoform X2 n=1 Tax=Nelumbo nucifera TaxID=4432 RepID=A0A1U7YV65_NELNU|nr:PREDICTED: photosynthetic NDH subunit of lumenal location 1, chloroplastic isoform X2 [Nelumbo nucifera]